MGGKLQLMANLVNGHRGRLVVGLAEVVGVHSLIVLAVMSRLPTEPPPSVGNRCSTPSLTSHHTHGPPGVCPPKSGQLVTTRTRL